MPLSNGESPVLLIQSAATRVNILECVSCQLIDNCRRPVPFSGPKSGSDIVIIGEAPGVSEDRAGVPFIGPAGIKAKQWLRLAGIDHRACTWMNVVCCYPGKDIKTPTTAHVAACGGNLVAQLEVIRPTFGLVLGSTALNAFLPGTKITKGRGKWWREVVNGKIIWMMATFHPAAILRDPNLEGDAMTDVLAFRRVYFDGREFPRMDECIQCSHHAEWWDMKEVGYCTTHRPKNKRLRRGLKEMEGQGRLF